MSTEHELKLIDDYIYNQNELPKPNKPPFDSNHKIWYFSGMFHQPDVFKVDKGPFVLYNLLRSYEIRYNVNSEFLKELKQEFYDKGWIVSSISYRTIKNKTGWTNHTVNKNIKKLIKLKWVIVSKVWVGKPRDQNVYILGRRDLINNKDEYFIYDFLL